MYTTGLLVFALASFKAMGAAVTPEARGITPIHPACVARMESCLGEMGLQGWQYGMTKLPDKYIKPWTICAKKNVREGVCADMNGIDVISEPGQMYLWQAQNNLIESHGQCTYLPCDNKGTMDLACDSLGCGICDVYGKCAAS
ncbi:hypothetical protein BDV96DRAFT_654252 [Lophiotrema nucula]|uniref:Secreted protein n=1 Tax=Lophiotrema nucula TaxID=690887 RepID=A0A6A5YKQ3_9PLEO|nr:hypothetical protein BDV96DRAFT_654252 [Lophiotrema nucula]